jgi:hypothetical protein
MKLPYQPPSVLRVGRVHQATADSRENNTDDTFFGLNGPVQGMGGSMDTCVTTDRVNCR